METIKPYVHIIEEAISKLKLNREPRGLYDPILYHLSLGGKRIRPILTLMACELFGKNPQEAINPALGLEVFHNFTLLHDDVMDKADLRRNKPTVHTKWGENTAILSGDAMQIMAYELICQIESTHLAQAINLFSTTALEITEGQQYDLDFETRNDVTLEEYIEMIRLKTAVLLGCAMQMGSIVAGASAVEGELLYNFGQNLGLAFQLQDDFLDVYGDPKLFGKKIGGDILNNKKTYLLIQAQQLANEEQLATLNKWIANNNPEESKAKIEAITQLYNELGIPQHCQETMDLYYKKAIDSLHRIAVPRKKLLPLATLASELMKRNY